MTLLAYFSHPEVIIEPAIHVPGWCLSEMGRVRVQSLAATGWSVGPVRILASPERKACETAELMAAQ